jgi:hypothetical protein
MTQKAFSFIVFALLSSAIAAGTVSAQQAPSCPSDWPEQHKDEYLAQNAAGFIAYQQMHTDQDGDTWFLIRSTDSNGYTTIRGYVADDRYRQGYVVGSPDEVCYLVVRTPADSKDATMPRQVIFPKEKEEQVTVTAVTPVTLRDILNRMNPDDRLGAVFCIINFAPTLSLGEILDDPDFVAVAVEHGCVPQP